MKETIQSKIFPVIIVVLIITVAFIVGFQVQRIWSPEFTEYDLVSEAQRLIDNNYIGDMPEELAIQRGMIRGMVAEIGDPYTTYVEPVMHELQTDNLSGEYGGIDSEKSVTPRLHTHLGESCVVSGESCNGRAGNASNHLLYVPEGGVSRKRPCRFRVRIVVELLIDEGENLIVRLDKIIDEVRDTCRVVGHSDRGRRG